MLKTVVVKSEIVIFDLKNSNEPCLFSMISSQSSAKHSLFLSMMKAVTLVRNSFFYF